MIKDSGVMTIDASMAIFFLVALFYFTLTHALLIRSEVILHTMTTNSAQELGQYSSLTTFLKQTSDEQKMNVIDLVASFTALKQTNDETFSHLQKQIVDFVNEKQTDNDKTISLDNVASHRIVTQFLAKLLFKQYIPGTTDLQKSIYLKRLGVLGGLEGLSFAHSKVFKKNKEWYVQVAVSCRVRGLYFQFLNYYHFIRHKVIVKVW